MTKHIEFYFDFGSPTAYLAYCRLGQLAKQYGLAIQYRPMLLGGVFKGAANTSPITVPAKGKYMLEQDLPRFARRYDVPLNFNPHFPINTLNLMRGVIAAEQLDCTIDLDRGHVANEGLNALLGVGGATSSSPPSNRLPQQEG